MEQLAADLDGGGRRSVGVPVLLRER